MIDLSVIVGEDESALSVQARLEEMHRLGWRGACLDLRAEQPQASTSWQAPMPGTQYGRAMSSAPRGLDVMRRLTLTASDAVAVQSVLGQGNKLHETYDVLAVCPTNDKVLQLCCTTLEIDIISLDLGQFLTMKINPGMLRTASKRGVRVEICYAPALRGPFSRRNLVVNCKSLFRGRGLKGVVVSGGTNNIMELRGPREVSSICKLLGLSQDTIRRGMTTEATGVAAQGRRRKAGIHKNSIIVEEAKWARLS